MTFRILTASLVGTFLATGAFAEVAVAQKDSKWFTDAQARIAELAAVTNNTGRARNVILFIADGNGVGSNYATRLWVGQKKGGLGDDYVLPQEMFPNLALVKTYTTNGQTPDSSPTASAMNTGVKSRNGTVNLDDAGDYDLLYRFDDKPYPEEVSVTTDDMTIRDYFAAKAMQGIISSECNYGAFSDLASDAYSIADAMLLAREAS